MNGTETDVDAKVAKILWLVFPPIYVVVGTIGNGLAILVLTRRKVHESTSTAYLVTLAVFDLIVLYSSLFVRWISELTEMSLGDMKGIFCKLSHWVDISSRDSSVWLLVAITMDRIIACSLPFRYKFICSRMCSRFVVAAVLFISYAVNVHLLVGLDMAEIWITNTTSRTICAFSSPEYEAFYLASIVFFDLMKGSLIPLLLIMSGSIAIVCLLYKKIIKLRRRINPNEGEQQNSDRVVASTNRTLLALNVVFLVCTGPLGIFFIASEFRGQESIFQAMKGSLWAFICMLLYLNNVLNFFIYTLTGSRFREHAKGLASEFLHRGPTRHTTSATGF